MNLSSELEVRYRSIANQIFGWIFSVGLLIVWSFVADPLGVFRVWQGGAADAQRAPGAFVMVGFMGLISVSLFVLLARPYLTISGRQVVAVRNPLFDYSFSNLTDKNWNRDGVYTRAVVGSQRVLVVGIDRKLLNYVLNKPKGKPNRTAGVGGRPEIIRGRSVATDPRFLLITAPWLIYLALGAGHVVGG